MLSETDRTKVLEDCILILVSTSEIVAQCSDRVMLDESKIKKLQETTRRIFSRAARIDEILAEKH